MTPFSLQIAVSLILARSWVFGRKNCNAMPLDMTSNYPLCDTVPEDERAPSNTASSRPPCDEEQQDQQQIHQQREERAEVQDHDYRSAAASEHGAHDLAIASNSGVMVMSQSRWLPIQTRQVVITSFSVTVSMILDFFLLVSSIEGYWMC